MTKDVDIIKRNVKRTITDYVGNSDSGIASFLSSWVIEAKPKKKKKKKII